MYNIVFRLDKQLCEPIHTCNMRKKKQLLKQKKHKAKCVSFSVDNHKLRTKQFKNVNI